MTATELKKNIYGDDVKIIRAPMTAPFTGSRTEPAIST